MQLARELHHISFLVDTNCINARQKMDDMNTLEKWSEDGVIMLMTSEVAQGEMVKGNNAQRIIKAYNFLSTMSKITTSNEKTKLKEIELIVFPSGAKNSNEMNDVEILFNSSKYMRPLITNDGASKSQPGGILGNKEKLKKIGIDVLTPSDAVAKVRSEIFKRDELARKMSELKGEGIPSWVGSD